MDDLNGGAMKVEDCVNIDVLIGHRFYRRILPWVCGLLIAVTNFCVFAWVPNEEVMGAVQRIFYFHVGAAMAAYLMIGVLFVASICYLNSRKLEWDLIAEAAASVGLLFCSVVLATGMIWGHSAWNTWWSWEPRIVSFLILWLILLSYVLLRGFSEDQAGQRNFSAVLGIIAAVNVPIVIYSIKLLDKTQQLHPEVVARQGLRDTAYVCTIILGNISMLLFSFWLLVTKAGNLLLARRLRMLALELRE